MPEPMHVLRPSTPRRAIGVAIQVALGGLLLWLAVMHPPSNVALLVFLVVLGVAVLALAQKGWSGSAQAIVLREDGLFAEDGVPIAPLDDIASVDRAIFSMKPSNGFLIRLSRPLGRAWVPGMWWRLGRRVGIGGVTRGADTKIVADALAVMISMRDGPEA